ncbi:hypothetical protein J2X02_001977 [Pseudoxanthomonas japonensis]|uniref:hypothetical protein n=1 Tax=Pseudoxanthomonas japonensis TaxID=69284 RepID=UPI0028646276|nr:hypothetical protein [Pseudoxanthomonas japonensis]MDR7069126.1 hypothetical protein [Pseudoxanthomonas japonensis]
MCTSAPDGDDASPRHYFADYEVYQDGVAIAWGQVTHSTEAGVACTPGALVAVLRAKASHAHEVDAGAIRPRGVHRL